MTIKEAVLDWTDTACDIMSPNNLKDEESFYLSAVRDMVSAGIDKVDGFVPNEGSFQNSKMYDIYELFAASMDVAEECNEGQNIREERMHVMKDGRAVDAIIETAIDTITEYVFYKAYKIYKDNEQIPWGSL
jgi:hypothetical protein